MANTINIPKSHLIMGLSLPLAVLLGYFVAEPMELGSLGVVVFVLVVLSIPLIMKWYYPVLVLSWNAAITIGFLPTRPALWALMAFGGLLFAVLNRAVSPNARFAIEPSINKPLLALTAVVLATGLMTGGFGVHLLGSSHIGGKNYFYFLASVAGYFVFTSHRIPPHRAKLYVGLFFLSAVTFALADLATLVGSRFNFLLLFLGSDSGLREAAFQGPIGASLPYVRMSGLSFTGTGIYGYLLARFGMRGVLDLTRPWRLLLLLAAAATGLASGFRSFLVLGTLMFAFLFCMEGLHRTRYLAGLLAVALLGSAVVLPQAKKLPLVVQRTISFLPGSFDYVPRTDAESSTGWRVEVWRQVLPEVPKTLFRGRGWGLEAGDFFTGVQIGEAANPLGATVLVGNYHNGPLSILIPFGIYGMVAFVWFLIAGLRLLHRNWKFGSPALQTVNGLLLAAFAARAVFFFCVFGSLHSDMAIFMGLLGLSVALNGADASLARAEEPATGVEFNTEYIKA